MACWLNYTCITRRRDKFFLATEDGEYSSAGPLMLNVALVKSGPPGPPLVAKKKVALGVHFWLPKVAPYQGHFWQPKVDRPRGPVLVTKSGPGRPVKVVESGSRMTMHGVCQLGAGKNYHHCALTVMNL